MLKIIDLDVAPKDCDGIVFTLTLNGEKTGFSEQEVVEILRARAGAGGKASARKTNVRGKATTNPVESEELSDAAVDGDGPNLVALNGTNGMAAGHDGASPSVLSLS